MILGDEKLLNLVSHKKSDVMKKIHWQIENSWWLDGAAGISIRILELMDHTNITKHQLAERSGISFDEITLILKGSHMTCIENLDKIQQVFNEGILGYYILNEK